MRVLEWESGFRDELVNFIRTMLVAGFWERGDLEEWVLAWVEDSGMVAPEEATALLAAMWDQRLAEQSSWPDTGDYGRLQQAFEHLQGKGVLARMCFSCCVRCATAEIDDERTADPDTDDCYRYREWAYTDFHEQDAQALGRPNPSVYLGYRAFRPHPALPPSLIDAARGGDPAASREMDERTDAMAAAGSWRSRSTSGRPRKGRDRRGPGSCCR
jgi:hypothetical protein